MLNNASKVQTARIAAAGVFIVIALKLLLNLSNNHKPNSSPSSWPTWSVSYFSSATPQPISYDSFLPSGPELDAHCSRYRFEPFADRTRRRKIYALTLINTELEWLEIRMGEMASEVDYFVIVESPVTFSDLPKPLYVRESWERFRPWHDKMILHTLNATNPTGKKFGDAWERERFNRNAMFEQVFPQLTGEQKAWPGDVIIVGDVDELVRPEVLAMLRNCDFPKRTRLHTTIYYYSFQWISQGQGHGDWDHPDATYFDGFKNTVLPQALRDEGAEAEVWSAGWHCSFCFDLLGDIVTKVKSYSHQEMNRPEILDPKAIFRRVTNGEDMFGRAGSDCHRVENNVDVPGYLQRNSERFKYTLDRDTEDGNFVDFYDVLGEEEEKV